MLAGYELRFRVARSWARVLGRMLPGWDFGQQGAFGLLYIIASRTGNIETLGKLRSAESSLQGAWWVGAPRLRGRLSMIYIIAIQCYH